MFLFMIDYVIINLLAVNEWQLKMIEQENTGARKFRLPIQVMGLSQKFLIQVRLGQPSLVWVWKISPKIPKFSHFFPKGKKISLGWVKKYPVHRQVSLLFTDDQKYVRVRSGPISATY